MKILFIASEVAPVAKVGGLGDVVYGLANQLVSMGHEVDVIIPKYDTLDHRKLKDLSILERDIWAQDGEDWFYNNIWKSQLEKFNLLLVEPHHPRHYFSRSAIYGEIDDNDRFLYFCNVCMHYLSKTQSSYDVVHVHDWPTAIIPVLYHDLYKAKGLKIGKMVLTIHNMQHQGKCSPWNLGKIGFIPKKPEALSDLSTPSLVNLLRAGIEYSDVVTTVSPTYKEEVKTPEYGFGLESLVVKYDRKFKGILNGIDIDYWNPKDDSYLETNFNPSKVKKEEDLPSILEAKAHNREELYKKIGMQPKKAPLVSCITRLVSQKSPDLIHHAIEETLKLGGQFILLGSCPSSEIEKEFTKLQQKYKDSKDLAIFLSSSEELAHQIYASSDLFIIPSRFEPCGLTQMISMRYGTLPLVRKTGGLSDTVFDIGTNKNGNGFTFNLANPEELSAALKRAFEVYFKQPEKWKKALYNAIKTDFSWKSAAKKYLDIY